jgi:hypothetical protein
MLVLGFCVGDCLGTATPRPFSEPFRGNGVAMSPHRNIFLQIREICYGFRTT